MAITTKKKSGPVPPNVSDPEGYNRFLPKSEFVKRRKAENEEKVFIKDALDDRDKKIKTDKEKAISEMAKDVIARTKECEKIDGQIKELESFNKPDKQKIKQRKDQLSNCKNELKVLQDKLTILQENKGESDAMKKAKAKVAAQKDISMRKASVVTRGKRIPAVEPGESEIELG